MPEHPPRFEILDISGDAGIRAFGRTLAEALVNAGLGMYSLITDTDGVDQVRTVDVEVDAETPGALAVRFLNELVFRFDAHGFVGARIDILKAEIGAERAAVTARVYGEEFDPGRHEQRLLVKAATYHNLQCAQVDGGWRIEVMFDI